jgi:ribosomal protein S10
MTSNKVYKIVLIFNSTNTKKLEENVNNVKTIIKSNGEVITGPVCFKHQRQLTATVRFNSTIDKLMKFNSHKSVNVEILVKS